MPVFMAGEMSFGHLQARMVVVSISSAMPCANLPITLAEAGATSTRSAFCHRNMFHLKGEIPVKGIHQTFISGEGFKGDWSDKLGGILGHDDLYIAV